MTLLSPSSPLFLSPPLLFLSCTLSLSFTLPSPRSPLAFTLLSLSRSIQLNTFRYHPEHKSCEGSPGGQHDTNGVLKGYQVDICSSFFSVPLLPYTTLSPFLSALYVHYCILALSSPSHFSIPSLSHLFSFSSFLFPFQILSCCMLILYDILHSKILLCMVR
jgi:hypothetical protein